MKCFLWSWCFFSKLCYALEFLVSYKNLILQWLSAPLCQKFWAEFVVRNKSTSLIHSNQILPATPLFRSVYVALRPQLVSIIRSSLHYDAQKLNSCGPEPAHGDVNSP